MIIKKPGVNRALKLTCKINFKPIKRQNNEIDEHAENLRIGIEHGTNDNRTITERRPAQEGSRLLLYIWRGLSQ